jgi:ferric-dicitrate binding protein FerR (iron transport regulator)
MNNYIDMNDVEQLIIDKLTGQIGEQDDLRLSDLIDRHQEVEQLWQQMQQVYAMRKAVNFDRSFNADDAWTALQQRVNIPDRVAEPVTDTVAIPVRNTKINWLRYGMAAAVTGIIIIGVYFLSDLNRSQGTDNGIQIKLANGKVVHAAAQDSLAGWMQDARDAKIDPGAWNTLMVPAGKSYAFQLADGSKVWLNAVSQLRFPLLFTQPERKVELKGEAYFNVAGLPLTPSGRAFGKPSATEGEGETKKVPFIVQVNGLTIKALGTEFNIKSYNGESTYISLINGSVAVENALGESITLSPGEAVTAADRNSHLRKEPFDETWVLGWMQGLYYFRNERLQHIAVVAERWFDIDVQLKDPALASLHFSGAMDRNKPVNTFFNMLSSSGGIRYDNKEGKVVISRN